MQSLKRNLSSLPLATRPGSTSTAFPKSSVRVVMCFEDLWIYKCMPLKCSCVTKKKTSTVLCCHKNIQKQAKRCFRWLPCQARLLKSESLVALSWEMPLLAITHNCIKHGIGQMQKGDWFRISRLSEIFGRYLMSRWLYVILWHLYLLGTYHSWFVAWHNLACIFPWPCWGEKNETGGININFK